MKAPKTLVIIGNGIASWRVNAELEKKFVDAKIIRIGSEVYGPMCTFKTTSVNCLRGTKKGISLLGDLVVDSYLEFEKFYEEYKPDGVDRGMEHQLWHPQGESAARFEKRFGGFEEVDEAGGIGLSKKFRCATSRAYFINPHKYYLWQTSQFNNTEYWDDFVVAVERKGSRLCVATLGGRMVEADKVFVCAGYLSGTFSGLVENEKELSLLSRSKPVRGSYLYCKSPVEIKSSQSLAVEKHHLIFRKNDNAILIGSTSENDSSLQLPMAEGLKKIYEEVKRSLAKPEILPPFDRLEVFHGIRHKGAKRMPFWGELGEDVYGVFGLYKNAFSYSFLAAKELMKVFDSGAPSHFFEK